MPISMKIRLMKALVWPVAVYGCESWTLRKNEETRLDEYQRVCYVLTCMYIMTRTHGVVV